MSARLGIAIAIVLVLGVRTFGAVYSYECDSLPEETGWTLLERWCEPEEWIADGRFYQRMQFCPGYDPPAGQAVFYGRSLGSFVGSERFFVEWRIQTDGHRSEIPFGAPAVFSAWSSGSVDYRFAIASDQARFVRDNRLPIVWVEFPPIAPHTFRLEMSGSDLYRLYVDGVVVDSGTPEGPYPSSTPAVNIGAAAQFVESTTIWDYIRWGDIPFDGSGDFDSDDDIDGRDFYFFHECLSNHRLGINGGPDQDAGPGCRFADFDDDTDVDLLDFAEFQLMFTGGE